MINKPIAVPATVVDAANPCIATPNWPSCPTKFAPKLDIINFNCLLNSATTPVATGIIVGKNPKVSISTLILFVRVVRSEIAERISSDLKTVCQMPVYAVPRPARSPSVDWRYLLYLS